MSTSALSEEDTKSFLTFLGKDYARLFRNEKEALNAAAALVLNEGTKRKSKPVESYLNTAEVSEFKLRPRRKVSRKDKNSARIDRIVAHDGTAGNLDVLEFRVRWRGFPEEHDEWFYYDQLQGSAALNKYLKHTPDLEGLLAQRATVPAKPSPRRKRGRTSAVEETPSAPSKVEAVGRQAIKRRKLELERLLLQKELELLELEEESA